MPGSAFNYTTMDHSIIKALIKKGVTIPNPESVNISSDVDPRRISAENVTLFSGTKLFGKQTLIMAGSKIGYESPVTLENTIVGKDCNLKGGFFRDAVFAGNNSFGSNAHVREGTILEEQANAAHTVGLKQTILFPFVTLGSLINFCDCFMAGGTSRENHSEVGSSFIHFNYTPNQDKATASLIGDVSKGVMLDSKPIFLGGQGGIVGPVRIGYGNISAAGSIIRKNELGRDRLILGGAFKDMSIPRKYGVYKNVSHIFNNNIIYIASLIGLNAWYKNVRPMFSSDFFSKQLVVGMQETLSVCINERIHRFNIFCKKLKTSRDILSTASKSYPVVATHDTAIKKGETALKVFKRQLSDHSLSDPGIRFLRIIENKIKTDDQPYIQTIQDLSPKEKEIGTHWLREIEQSIIKQLII